MSLISSKISEVNSFNLGQVSVLDEICPSFVDTKNPKYLKVVWGIGYKVEKI